MLDNGALREVGSSDLLSDAASLSCLHVSSSKFIKDESLASIDVAQDTENWASEFSSSDFFELLSLEDLLFPGLLFRLEFSHFLLSLLLSLSALLLHGFRKHISTRFLLFLLACLHGLLNLVLIFRGFLLAEQLCVNIVFILLINSDCFASCGRWLNFF